MALGGTHARYTLAQAFNNNNTRRAEGSEPDPGRGGQCIGFWWGRSGGCGGQSMEIIPIIVHLL